MKKLIFTLLSFAISSPVFSQENTVTPLRASDPTQPFTSIDFNAGLNFTHFGSMSENSELDSWEFGLKGDFAIKNFGLGVFLSSSNNGQLNQLINDVKLDFKYQIHKNSGFYSSSLIKIGLSSPTFPEMDDLNLFNPYDNATDFLEINMTYTGALRLKPNLSFYPTFEIYHRSKENSYIYVNLDSVYFAPDITQNGIRLGGMLAYDWKNSFIQLGSGWSTGNWDFKNGSIAEDNNQEYSDQTWFVRLKYQYAISDYSQVYLSFYTKNFALKNGNEVDPIRFGLTNLSIGFKHFLN